MGSLAAAAPPTDFKASKLARRAGRATYARSATEHLCSAAITFLSPKLTRLARDPVYTGIVTTSTFLSVSSRK